MVNHRLGLCLLVAVAVLGCGDGLNGPQAQPVALHVRVVGFEPPVTPEATIGDVLTLKAYAVDADSAIIGPAIPVTWQSSDTVVATVTQQGILYVRCVGVTNVSAKTTVAGQPLSGRVALGVGMVVESAGSGCIL